DEAGSSQRLHVDAAEIDGRELARVERELGLVVAPTGVGTEPVAAGVPRAERVTNLDDDRFVGRPGARANRSVGVDEAEPEPVVQRETKPARVARAEKERRGRIDELALDRRREVEREEEAPQLALGYACRREHLDDVHGRVRSAVLPFR